MSEFLHEDEARAIAKEILTPKQWDAVELVYLRDYSIRRAARHLDVDEAAVRRRLERADRTLKDNVLCGELAQTYGVGTDGGDATPGPRRGGGRAAEDGVGGRAAA